MHTTSQLVEHVKPRRLVGIELEGRTHLTYRLTTKGLHRLDVPLSQRVDDGRLRQLELFDHCHGSGSQGT
jgi:hypothetical protein